MWRKDAGCSSNCELLHGRSGGVGSRGFRRGFSRGIGGRSVGSGSGFRRGSLSRNATAIGHNGLTAAVLRTGATTGVTDTTLTTNATFATNATSAFLATDAADLLTAASSFSSTFNLTATGIGTMALTAETGHSLRLTAHQGDPDDGEERRDAEDDYSIHSESSKQSTVTETDVACAGVATVGVLRRVARKSSRFESRTCLG